jgi:regulator of RNase E activity RraB
MHRLLVMISIFGFLFGSAGAQDETRSERSTREKKDREVIRELSKAGSNLSKPHRIEFHFVGYVEAKVMALADEGRKAGYSVSSVDSMADKDARKYWYFDLIQDVVLTERNIFGHTAMMTKLANKYGVEFDGWGCLIVK